MWTKLPAILVLTLLMSGAVFATAQAPDKLIYEGKEYSLHSNPMEWYFQKYPNKRPKSGIVSSGLWRGYIATFEIKEAQLFLKDIEIFDRQSGEGDLIAKSVLSEIVPKGQQLKVDWFTGLLVLPQGKILNYVHMGYGSTYEKYTLLEIVAGGFKRAKDFDHKSYSEFKEKQFEAFKRTAEYKKAAEGIRKQDPTATQEFIDSFLRSFITDYTSRFLVE